MSLSPSASVLSPVSWESQSLGVAKLCEWVEAELSAYSRCSGRVVVMSSPAFLQLLSRGGRGLCSDRACCGNGMGGGAQGRKGARLCPGSKLTPSPWALSADQVRKMSSPGVGGDPKPPCLPRNGLVKLPGQPNGLGAASITKGTPAAKNRPCQPPPPTLAVPPARAALAGGLCPPAGLPLGGPASAPVPGPPAERPPLATDEKILNGLFWYFSACEKCVLAQVCKAWRRVLYQPKFWAGLTPVLHAKELYTVLPGGEKEFVNLQGFAARGFEGFCLVGVSDLDICEFIDNYALSKKGVKAMSLKRSTITDAGLEVRPATGPEGAGMGGRARQHVGGLEHGQQSSRREGGVRDALRRRVILGWGEQAWLCTLGDPGQNENPGPLFKDD